MNDFEIYSDEEGNHRVKECPECGEDHEIEYERGPTGISRPSFPCEGGESDG